MMPMMASTAIPDANLRDACGNNGKQKRIMP